MSSTNAADFSARPHKTLITLSIPVLFSLIAEPLTGLIDTGFVSDLGAVALAALGVGTIALSSTFWVFNFLGIGTQTEVAQALGRGAGGEARRINGLALVMAAGFGILLILIGLPLASRIALFLGAEGEILREAQRYMQVRLFGAPAVLLTLTAMGTLRGLQDMRTPLWIAVGVNGLNLLLDPLLIFGLGPVPSLGVAGAALASTLAQWVGGLAAAAVVLQRLGRPTGINLAEAGRLLTVGRDLFFRTGLLMLFLLFATRVATQIGAASGAANQAIRQVWFFSALTMEAFAISGQSLVGYFIGADDRRQARRVAWITTWWSVATGVALTGLMIALQNPVARWLVPPEAWAVFAPAWLVAALAQPLNAVAFNTDGLHWGTGDYRYLRNGMLAATLTGGIGLLLIDVTQPRALTWVWVATVAWIGVRALFGVLRIWPGIGASPYRPAGQNILEKEAGEARLR